MHPLEGSPAAAARPKRHSFPDREVAGLYAHDTVSCESGSIGGGWFSVLSATMVAKRGAPAAPPPFDRLHPVLTLSFSLNTLISPSMHPATCAVRAWHFLPAGFCRLATRQQRPLAEARCVVQAQWKSAGGVHDNHALRDHRGGRRLRAQRIHGAPTLAKPGQKPPAVTLSTMTP